MDRGMRYLALAVIAQALKELERYVKSQRPSWAHTSAARFLLAETGPWQRSREIWSHIAGKDPAYLLRKTRERIKLWSSPDAP